MMALGTRQRAFPTERQVDSSAARAKASRRKTPAGVSRAWPSVPGRHPFSSRSCLFRVAALKKLPPEGLVVAGPAAVAAGVFLHDLRDAVELGVEVVEQVQGDG